MNIFRRSMSSSSSRSLTSTTNSTSDSPTPRSSFESNHSDNDISTSLATIKMKKAPPAPLLNLPIELIQQITSYLDNASAASFCLSSRFICYAVGTNHLSSYIAASKSRFEKRRTIEAVVERAFPGHWFCAWCDKFHAWSPSDGPKEASVAVTAGTKGANPATKRKRDCAEFNSYLHDGSDYVLYYHHVRLAINRALWGPAHGIPLSSLAHTSSAMTKIFKTPCPTRLQITPVITRSSGEHPHLLLHTTYALIIPNTFTPNKRLLPTQIWPSLPHILAGHRDFSPADNGHTGLMAAIDNVVRRGWTYPRTQTCGLCRTDWSVSCVAFRHASGGQVRLVVQSWRDLGAGRGPFESGWRAHGVARGAGSAAVRSGERVEGGGLEAWRAGEVRRAFESAVAGAGVGVGGAREERARSASRSRIYRSFMRKKGDEDGDGEGEGDVRRSRARPSIWRTKSENEEVQRLEDDARLEESRDVAEGMVRLDACALNL